MLRKEESGPNIQVLLSKVLFLASNVNASPSKCARENEAGLEIDSSQTIKINVTVCPQTRVGNHKIGWRDQTKTRSHYLLSLSELSLLLRCLWRFILTHPRERKGGLDEIPLTRQLHVRMHTHTQTQRQFLAV